MTETAADLVIAEVSELEAVIGVVPETLELCVERFLKSG